MAKLTIGGSPVLFGNKKASLMSYINSPPRCGRADCGLRSIQVGQCPSCNLTFIGEIDEVAGLNLARRIELNSIKSTIQHNESAIDTDFLSQWNNKWNGNSPSVEHYRQILLSVVERYRSIFHQAFLTKSKRVTTSLTDYDGVSIRIPLTSLIVDCDSMTSEKAQDLLRDAKDLGAPIVFSPRGFRVFYRYDFRSDKRFSRRPPLWAIKIYPQVDFLTARRNTFDSDNGAFPYAHVLMPPTVGYCFGGSTLMTTFDMSRSPAEVADAVVEGYLQCFKTTPVAPSSYIDDLLEYEEDGLLPYDYGIA